MDRAKPDVQSRHWRSARTITALILREMSTTYGRSPGGYFWAIAEPAAGIALLSVVFSYAFRAPAIGNSFPVFYATGFLPFMLYLDLSKKIANSIAFSRPLLMYPAVTYVDAIIARLIVNLATHVMVFIIVVWALITFFDPQVILDHQAIILSLALAAMLALGVGVMNCLLISLFPVWESVWSIVNRPMFVISGVIFAFKDIPQPLRDWLWFNPLVHVIGQMRAGFYPTYDGSYVSPAYVMGFALVTLAAGLALLRLLRRSILGEA